MAKAEPAVLHSGGPGASAEGQKRDHEHRKDRGDREGYRAAPPVTILPTLRCRPPLVSGMPMDLDILDFAAVIPRSLFHENPPLFIGHPPPGSGSRSCEEHNER